MDLEIRPYAEPDREALIDLWQRCGLVVEHNDPDEDIDRKLAHDPEHLLVAVDRDLDDGTGTGTVVGSVMVGYEGRRGWLNLLAVHPDHQGNGIGKRLMDRAESILADLGCPKINLQIRTSNTEVIEYYKELGYFVDDAISLATRLGA